MTHSPERYEIPERIKAIISTTDPDELEELFEWLDECTEMQYEAYVNFMREVPLVEATEGGSEDDEDERY